MGIALFKKELSWALISTAVSTNQGSFRDQGQEMLEWFPQAQKAKMLDHNPWQRCGNSTRYGSFSRVRWSPATYYTSYFTILSFL